MNSRNETISHLPDSLQFDHEIANLAERCRILAADVERIRRSRTALDRGDGGSSDLQDGHAPEHATGYTENHAKTQSPGGRRRFRTGKLALLILLAGIAILGGLWLWLRLGTYESTDDAQINGHVIPMSARISGTVVRVYVQNTQFVTAGSPLADLDVRDYQVAVEKARADFEQAKAQVAGAHGDYQVGQAKLAQSKATNLKLQQDAERYDTLLQGGVTAREQYDEAIRAARVGAAAVESDRASVAALQKQIASREAIVAAAKASLDQALLNLSYTRIVAPVSGVVGKKTVEVGQQVEPGQQLLAIVPLDDLWVTANFKETQLRLIRLGQRVSIHVDALGSNYNGYVEGLAGASGELYSVLPPENATGNYIKVVQRFPVQIRFDPTQDPAHRLRPGMSVESTVWLNEPGRDQH
jgi:membrane fusion protein, multidrug efflux system